MLHHSSLIPPAESLATTDHFTLSRVLPYPAILIITDKQTAKFLHLDYVY